MGHIRSTSPQSWSKSARLRSRCQPTLGRSRRFHRARLNLDPSATNLGRLCGRSFASMSTGLGQRSAENGLASTNCHDVGRVKLKSKASLMPFLSSPEVHPRSASGQGRLARTLVRDPSLGRSSPVAPGDLLRGPKKTQPTHQQPPTPAMRMRSGRPSTSASSLRVAPVAPEVRLMLWLKQVQISPRQIRSGSDQTQAKPKQDLRWSSGRTKP